MTAPLSLFKLASELVQIHERSAPGVVTVVPVLVDDLARALPVLDALCSVLEGRLLESNASELQDAVPATTDTVRRTAIEQALNTQPAGGTRYVVLVDNDDTTVDAEYREPPGGSEASAGERAVLAVARAVAHEELDDREFAVVTYRESGVDYPFRRCLWSLAVDQLAGLPHPTLRTLVFVAEATIDIDLHCQTGRGFRLALDGHRFLRRHVADDLTVSASWIAQQEHPVVFFLGAGFGASSKLPLGNTLRDSALRRLLAIPDDEEVSPDVLGRRFHAWISEREGWLTESEMALREDDFVRNLTLEQVIRAERRMHNDLPTLREFRAHHDHVIGTPGQAAVDFGYVLGQMVGRVVVVEVNFDQLVERHCSVPHRIFHSDEAFEDAEAYIDAYLAGNEQAIPILKIHGSIEEPETCVVSDEQTQQGIGDGKLAALRALLSDPKRVWVYVGASLRDSDLLPVMSSEEFARGLDERWVSPFLDASVEDFANQRAPFWEGTQYPTIDHRLISETADAFFGALRAEF